MPYLSFLFVLFFSTQGFSEVLKSSDGRKWPLVESKSWKVSPDCLKNNCLALKPLDPKKIKSLSSEALAHPAAGFCELHQGRYEIVQYDSGDQDGLCVFKDKSYILGWDYYRKNQKQTKEKK